MPQSVEATSTEARQGILFGRKELLLLSFLLKRRFSSPPRIDDKVSVVSAAMAARKRKKRGRAYVGSSFFQISWKLGHVSTFEGVQKHVDDHLFMAYAKCVLSACMLEDGYTGYLMMSATRHFEKNEPCCTNLTHKNAVMNSLVTVCFILTQVGRSQHLPRYRGVR